MLNFKRFLIFLPVFALIFSAWILPDENNWEDKISDALFSKMEKNTSVDFLIVLKEQANFSTPKNFLTKEEKGSLVYQKLQHTAIQAQRDLLKYLKYQNIPYQSFYIVNAISARADKNIIETIARRNDVRQLLDNSLIEIAKPIKEITAEERGPDAIEWGIEMINTDDVWAMGYTGEGVVVGGKDTGVEWFHPAIKNKYRGWDGNGVDHNYNWHDAIHVINPLHMDSIVNPFNNPCGLNAVVPCDDHNHGTHTVGTMVGSDGENQIGVAPEAKWIACRNMERGYGSPTTYIECFEWFLAPTDLTNQNPDPTKAPHVINNSWSCPEMEGCNADNWDVMNTVVNNLKAAGIVVVVSAGNSGSQGCGSVSAPAAMFENSFTVGSSRANDTISSFSSRGPVLVDGSGRMKPNVVAPGSQVRSCVRNGGYGTWSGTSMAGPHVAGLVALLISAKPDLAGQVEEIETIIESSAIPKMTDEDCGDIPGINIPNNTYGFGRVDALAAVYMALGITVDTEELQNNPIRVYPNPTNDFLHFDLSGLKGRTTLSIYDARGNLLRQAQWTLPKSISQQVNLGELPSGIYFYQIQNEDQNHSGKVLKE